MGLKRAVEEIGHRYTLLAGDGTERYLMVVTGQVEAVMAVAEEMRKAQRIVSYGRHAANETALLFPVGAFRDVEPIEVFQEVKAAAWKVIDPRGQG